MTGQLGPSRGANEMTGRADEQRVLDGLIASVRSGRGRSIVLRGGPGIGKTALLEQLADSAEDVRILRAVGSRAEADLPFAALHQLFGTMTTHLDELPPPQRTALRVAFGLEDGEAPDLYAIALGVLNLVGDLARVRPVLCLVDDEQWLDRATLLSLSFVARRIESDAVGFVFASRGEARELTGLPRLTVPGLSADHAYELLDSVLPGPLDPAVRSRLVSETRGNPRALLELGSGTTLSDWAGGYRYPGVLPVRERVTVEYRRRLDALPWAARQFLLLAAADPVGDPTSLWTAASWLGLEPADATPALESTLLDVAARVRFGDPLVRSVVYRSATVGQRRAVHGALAMVTDPQANADWSAWHRANATDGPDEEVASALERATGQARARGGLAAVAAFLEQAAALTADPAARVRRLVGAAEAAHDAGSSDQALELVESAMLIAVDEDSAARIMWIRGLIAAGRHRREDAVGLLLGAAGQLRGHSPEDANAALLAALTTALRGDGADDVLVVRVASAVADVVPEVDEPVTLTDVLLRALLDRATLGYADAAPAIRSAVDTLTSVPQAELSQAVSTSRALLLLPSELCDHEAWHLLATRQVSAARRDGAFGVLPAMLDFAALRQIVGGDLVTAGAFLDESASVTATMGAESNLFASIAFSAWRGDAAQVGKLARAPRSADGGVAYAEAVLANADGRFDAAFEAARRLFHGELLSIGAMAATELLDAASRVGAIDDVRTVHDWLEERLRAAPNPWLLGLRHRARALLVPDESAEAHYAESIGQFRTAGLRSEVARSQLLFGEWLRRRARRGDSRRQLREAHDAFRAMGAEGFQGRAGRELQATGDVALRAADRRRSELTPQEAQIATLAGAGLTNPEIGGRLFISPRTVQYHLRKVFLKLDITSRAQLRHALSLTGGARPDGRGQRSGVVAARVTMTS